MNTVEPIRDLKTIKRMRAVLKSQSTRNELLFILGINVGLRISDILKLKFSDVLKPNKKTIKDSVTIKEKKTRKTKTFYIGEVVTKVLKAYIEENPNFELDDYIFKSRKGENCPITRQQAYRILNKAAEIIGIVERDPNTGELISGAIGTHTCRKVFGYFAYQNGTSLELLMDLFNHSSKEITLRYIGITEQQKKNIYLNSNLG